VTRRLTAAAAGLLITASIAIAPAAASAVATRPHVASAPLTKLAHLDFLTT
jgi:hypothetical protein